MRILFLCNKMPFPPNDGGSIATLNMVCGLSQHQNDIDVLAMQTYKHNFAIDKIPAQYAHIKWHSVWVNTRPNILKMVVNFLCSPKPYNAVRFESTIFKEKLGELLQNNQYDLVQLEGLYLAPCIETIRQYSKAKISLRAHNVEWEIWQRLYESETRFFHKYYKKILFKRIKKMEAQAMGKIDLLVPITHRDAMNLPFSQPDKIAVSSTGIVPQYFKQDNQPKIAKSLYYIGALDWEPNREALLWFIEKVWIYIKIDHPDWDFYVAGRNAPNTFVKELKNLGVIFMGQVESAQQFIDDHNINIVPLFSGSGMRIKIIEGMARSRCIVTTPVGTEGIEAVSGEQIWICNNADDMIQIIKRLIKQPDLVEKTAQNAYRFARENCDNLMITGKLNNFYRKWI